MVVFLGRMIDPEQDRKSEQKDYSVWESMLGALAQRPGVTIFLGASDTGKTTGLRAAAIDLARAEK